MDFIIDQLAGFAVGALFWLVVFLVMMCLFYIYARVDEDGIEILPGAIYKSILFIIIGGYIAYLPSYFGFEFYYYGKYCPHGGYRCPEGYQFKIDMIISFMGSGFIFLPAYASTWAFIDKVWLYIGGLLDLFLQCVKKIKDIVLGKKYKDDGYKKDKAPFKKKDK